MAAALKQVGKRAALGISQQLISPHLEKVPTLVFLGPPGVGKGTYSTRIAEKLGFAHISVGDLLRNEIRAQTEPGRLVGNPVPRTDVPVCDCFCQVIVCTAHVYGVALYYLTNWNESRVHGVAYSRPETVYFWIYYVGFNLPWAIVPLGELDCQRQALGLT